MIALRAFRAPSLSAHRPRGLAAASLIALCLAGFAAPSFAQDDTAPIISRDDLARRDKAMRERIDKLEKVVRQLREVMTQSKDTGQTLEMRLVSEPDPDIAASKTRLDDLEATVRTINGRLDDIGHDLDLTRKTLSDDIAARRASDEKIDKLAARIQALEAAAQPVVSEQAAPSEEQPAQGVANAAPAATPETAYAQGKSALLAKDYASAASIFQDFTERFPDAPQAPEARYWLGESFFIQKSYAEAANAYLGAIRGWPTTNWAPNATVKLALSLIALKNNDSACQALAEFDRHYTKAPPSVLASAKAARAQAKCS